ncbi:MAG: SocA family protein [Proteobacteria bacterium]|nr:SocA family protein [Pseudomonadota bacterium]MCH8951154.1 SocA family protein [Pseudomonadota bacterium]
MTIMDEGFQFDRNKFLDVVHYIAGSCRPEELGRVKLHKILYFADMHCFLAFGKPLTGENYIKQKFGPTARHLQSALRELEQDGRVQVSERSYHGYPKQDFIAQKSLNQSALPAEEIKLLDDVIDFVCARTAREISELSHNEAWRLAEMGESIPYFMAYSFVPTEITDDDREWARQETERVLQSAN